MSNVSKLLVMFIALIALVTLSSSMVLGAIITLEVTDGTSTISELVVEEERGESAEGEFTIENLDPLDPVDVYVEYDDADFTDKGIDLSFDPISNPQGPFLTIVSLGTLEVKITATIDDDILLDSYKGMIKVVDKDNPITNFAEFELIVRVRPRNLCSDGSIGELVIDDIDEPNPNTADDFLPGDKIKIKVDIENNYHKNLDVEFTAFLVDKEEDDVLEEESDAQEIRKNGKEERFSFNLEFPKDIEGDEGDDIYAVYVQAIEEGEEEDHCVWQQVDIDIDRDKDDVLVENIEIQRDTLMCGMINDLTTTVINAGNNDADDMKVRLSFLDLTLTALNSVIFDLDEEDDKVIPFILDLPAGITARDYTLRIEAIEDDGNVFDRGTEDFKVAIECAPAEPKASLTLSQSSFNVRRDSSFTTTATVKNTGEAEETFTLRVTPLGTWTDSFETDLTLANGESQSEVITLNARQEGSQAATVEVLSEDGTVLVSRTMTVNVSNVIPLGITGAVTATTFGTALSKQWPLFLAIGILALVIIGLLIWLISTYTAKGGNGRGHNNSKDLRKAREGVKGKRK